MINEEYKGSLPFNYDSFRRSSERNSLPIPIRKPSTMPTPNLVLPTIDGYTISHSLLMDNIPTDPYGFLLDERLVGTSLQSLKAFELEYSEKLERQAQRWASLVPVAKGDLAIFPPPSKKIKRALRKGLPKDLRPNAWFHYSGAQACQDAEPKRYVELIKLAKCQANFPLESQIDSDVSYTFANNRRFRTLKVHSPFLDLDPEEYFAQFALKRVLLAIAHAFPEVSYTNGLNSIVAALLLVTENEQRSFWITYQILSTLLPENYYVDMNLGCNVDQDVLGALIAWKLPAVYRKLQTLEISLHLVTATWFTHLYVDQLPFESLLRVWDSFLLEGSKVLFRIALALFKINQNALLEISDPFELAAFIRRMPKRQVDTIELIDMAFNGIGWFSHSWLAQERRQAAPYWNAKHSVRRFSRVSPAYCQTFPSQSLLSNARDFNCCAPAVSENVESPAPFRLALMEDDDSIIFEKPEEVSRPSSGAAKSSQSSILNSLMRGL